MKCRLEVVLDSCIHALENGQDLEEILAGHSDVADELRPMLAAAALTRLDVPPPTRKLADKRRLMDTVATRRRLVESVDGYVTEVRVGVPFQQVVARAPAHLRPVVTAAWRMFSTEPPLVASERFAEGRRLVVAAAERRRAELNPTATDRLRATSGRWFWACRGALGHLAEGMRPAPGVGRRIRAGAMAAVSTVVVSAGVMGVGTAAAGSLPGEALYPMKRLGESARLLVALDSGTRAALNVRFAERRLAEMTLLAEGGKTVPQAVMEEWLDGQIRAWAEVRRMPEDDRIALSVALVELVKAGAARESELTAFLGGGASFEALLARYPELAALVTTAQSSARPVDVVPVPGESLASGPMAVPRPLPQEEPPRETRGQRQAEPPAAPLPIQQPVAAEAGGEPPAGEAPVISQPVASGNRDDNRSGSAPSGPPAGEEPAAPEPTASPTQAPVSFRSPPIGTATPEPSPSPPPEP